MTLAILEERYSRILKQYTDGAITERDALIAHLNLIANYMTELKKGTANANPLP